MATIIPFVPRENRVNFDPTPRYSEWRVKANEDAILVTAVVPRLAASSIMLAFFEALREKN